MKCSQVSHFDKEITQTVGRKYDNLRKYWVSVELELLMSDREVEVPSDLVFRPPRSTSDVPSQRGTSITSLTLYTYLQDVPYVDGRRVSMTSFESGTLRDLVSPPSPTPDLPVCPFFGLPRSCSTVLDLNSPLLHCQVYSSVPSLRHFLDHVSGSKGLRRDYFCVLKSSESMSWIHTFILPWDHILHSGTQNEI